VLVRRGTGSRQSGAVLAGRRALRATTTATITIAARASRPACDLARACGALIGPRYSVFRKVVEATMIDEVHP
jgi:hypothetical protein